MLRSFDGLALRQMRTRRLRAGLVAAAVALGTGMVLGVLLLSGTIRHTFDDLISSAWGTTDLVVAPADNAGVMPDRALARIRATPGVRSASPMIGTEARRLDTGGHAIRGTSGTVWLAGVDPASPAYDFRQVAGRPIRSGDEVMIERNWARARDVDVGDTLALATAGGRVGLRVVGIFKFSNGLSFGGAGLAAMPIDAARPIMDLPDGLMSISVAVTDRRSTDAVARRLRAALGRGFDVQTPSAVADDVKQQLRALDIVLLLFSGLALFVGGFLIFNSFTMTVAQRLRELGMLRTLGADRRDVARTVLLEATIVAVVGALVGIAFGIGLAAALLALVRGLGVPVGTLQVAPASIAIAVTAGVVATIAGAWVPARRAGRVSPIRATLGDATTMRRRPTVRRAIVAIVLILPGLLLGGDFWFGDQNDAGTLDAIYGIGITMVMFAGIVVGAPFVIGPLVAALSAPLRRVFPTVGRLAADAARANPLRTAATAAALTVGFAVVVVNLTMSHSLVSTIEHQLGVNLARDLTVRPVGAGLERGGSPPVPRNLTRDIAALPEAGVVTPVRSVLITLPMLGSGGDQGLAIGIDPGAYGQVDRTPISGATREQALAGVARGEVIIGGGLAGRADLHVGDTFVLQGPEATRRLRVAGVLDAVADFHGNEVQMSLATMRALYGVTADAQVAVTARTPQQRPALQRAVERLIERDAPGMEALSTGELRDSVTAQVRQQFNLFNSIVAVAILVSLLGVVNTLAMSVLERTREIGVLRALGAGRARVGATMVAESLLVTISGSLAGLAVGAGVAFWWMRGMDNLLPGMTFRFPVGAALVIVVAAVLLGALAAAMPARRAARLDVVRALEAE